MSSGRAAEWAEYFTDEHTKIVQGNRVFNPEMTWAEFMKLLDQNFDLRRTKDSQNRSLSVKDETGRTRAVYPQLQFACRTRRIHYDRTREPVSPRNVPGRSQPETTRQN